MATAVIVDAVRTAGGKRNGKLSGWHPADLAAEALKALVERNDLDPALIDDVIMGCVMQVGDQALNIGRNAVLAAGLPETVPATTIDRQCGSSQQSAHFAAQGVIAGAYDIVIAAGVEVMTLVPMGASVADGKFGFPFGPTVDAALRRRRRPRAAGHLGRAHRRQVGPHPRRPRRLRRPEPAARRAGHRGGPLRERDHRRSARPRDKETASSSSRRDGHADEGIRPDTTVETLAKLEARRSSPTARSPPATRRRSPTAPRPC